jgi:Ca2+-binding RTX toxin-like protein
MTFYTGTAGNDSFTGSALSDSFDLSQGGNDTAKGGNGYDSFTLGAELTAADRINGGAGYDYLYLNGDYSGGLVLGATTVVNIEQLYLYAGHSYNITTDDNTNNLTGGMNIYGGSLGATDVLTFDGSAETASGYSVTGGAGDDVITTGAGADYAYLQGGGRDTVNLGGGSDQVYTYDALSSGDHLDGGSGNDTLQLSGSYGSGLTFGASTIQNFEYISLWSGNSYSLTFNDDNIAAGQGMTIYGSSLGAGETLTVNGSAENDGYFIVYGGPDKDKLTGGKGDDSLYGNDGADKLYGGAGDDFLQGGTGHDTLTGGGGGDIFYFYEGDAPLGNPDLIADLNNSNDVIDLSGIDADTTAIYDQQFNLVSSFNGTPGQLTRSYDGGTDVTSFLMDTNGDSVADIIIQASGDHHGFSNFVL